MPANVMLCGKKIAVYDGFGANRYNCILAYRKFLDLLLTSADLLHVADLYVKGTLWYA